MPTFVTFERLAIENPNVLIFGVWNYENISEVYVKGFENGMCIIEASPGTIINDFIEFVEGIFHPESNFSLAVCDRYHIPKNTFKGVKFDFNGIKFEITKDNANAKKMLEYWQKQYKELVKKKRRFFF